jgi:hypothetical protein
MLTVKNQSCPQTIKASRPPTTLSVGGVGCPVSVVTSQQHPARTTSPTSTTCMHSKLGPSSSVPAQPLSAGKPVLGNNAVPLATFAAVEQPPDPKNNKNNNVFLLQTNS